VSTSFVGVGARGNGGIYVTMDDNAIANMAQPGGIVDRYTKGKAGAVAGKARQIVPVKSGRLRGSIKVAQARDIRGRYSVGYNVEADAPYARYVHDGTRPHVIEGNPLLVFQIGGATVFTRRVNHPGTKGNPFLVRAAQAVFAGPR
jgi:hypothetical protein